MFLLNKKQQARIYVFEDFGVFQATCVSINLSLSDKEGQTDEGTDESWATKRGSVPGLVLRLCGSNLF